MPPPHLPVPKAAKPRHAPSFDPWNSSSTGHQRADTSSGTGWRESRNKKLQSQFQAGGDGGARLSDTCGAGAEDWDPKLKTLVPKSLKDGQGRSVMDMLTRPGKMQESLARAGSQPPPDSSRSPSEETLMEQRKKEDEEKETQKGQRGIFDGTVIFVNGSTFPLVSDHKLKQIITENSGQMSLHLGRRRVTHVILAKPSGSGLGAGGGLAGGKLEKEIKRVSGCGVKFVGVEW